MPSARMIALLVLLLLLGCDGEHDRPTTPDDETIGVSGRIRSAIDAIPAISNHDHLHPSGRMPFKDATEDGMRVTLHSLWAGSYLRYQVEIAPWPANNLFATWWEDARGTFDRVRAVGFYRYLLVAFRDLYGVDFDTITDDQAWSLNARIGASHEDPDWVRKVVVEKANIEMVIVDPFWSRILVRQEDDFTAPLLNVHTLITSSHPDRNTAAGDSVFEFARKRDRDIATFDDYLSVVDLIVEEAIRNGAVGLKSTQAYERTLRFERVPKARAAAGFGRPPSEITASQQKDFEDFMMWRIAALSAEHELPLQIHTGLALPDCSNPLLLLDLIVGNPDTRFVLLHGGFPWIDDMAILAKSRANVWIDASWLPTISYAVAKRAFQVWLECVPAERIVWGADSVHPEGVYAACIRTRACLSEALTEKVIRGELREEHAIEIGRMIMRENVIALYPRLEARLGSR